jgi:hypothetical protein
MDKLKTAGFWSVGLAMMEPDAENPYKWIYGSLAI